MEVSQYIIQKLGQWIVAYLEIYAAYHIIIIMVNTSFYLKTCEGNCYNK